MTLQEALHSTTKELLQLYPSQTAPTVALWLLEKATSYSQSQLILRYNELLSEQAEKLLKQIVYEHLHTNKPLAYILETVPFLSVDLAIRPPLLIPRSETEYWCSWLIEQIKIEHSPDLTILDLCSGSGCIGIALGHAFPNATIYAVDSSAQACALTQENAEKQRLSSFHCIQSNLYSALPKEVRFDLIVSNPPYISLKQWSRLEPSVKDWEDPHALVAKDEGMALITTIIDQAPQWLSAPLRSSLPQLVIECGYQQGALVKQACEKAGFVSVTVHKDRAGHDRFVTAHYQRAL